MNVIRKCFRSNKVESEVKTAQPTKITVWIETDNSFKLRLRDIEFTTELYAFARKRFFEHMGSTLCLSTAQLYEKFQFAFFFKGKPLSQREVRLTDYNIRDNDVVELRVFFARGGTSLPEFQVGISYNVLVEDYMLRSMDHIQHRFKLQANESDADLMKWIYMYMNKYYDTQGNDNVQWLFSQLDNLILVSYWFKKCDSLVDYEKLIQMAYKLITGRMMYGDLVNYFVQKYSSNLQANDAQDFLSMLRQGLNGVTAAGNAPIFKKVVSMYSYLLVHGFLEKFGITVNDLDYSKLEQKALYATYSSKKDMWLCILDTTLFICEKIQEFRICGDISVFMHSTTEYSKWIKEADRLLALAPFVSNLEAHGTTYFAFVSDISNAIERGTAYAKYTNDTSGTDCVLLKRRLQSLQLVKNTEITRRASQKERQAPFGVLVYGSSSVAKSTFSKMLFYYYGSLHNLDKDEHFRYVRNPADEYWSNFDSSKWCIQMDDIAFLHPNKTSEADPTLMEMLNVVNNVPYVPPQAAIEDKGKTPVLAKLVVATTNALDLNAADYFWCPLAVRRRLPYVLTVKPKQEFLHENGRFIEPTKLSFVEGEYPDYWDITVHKIVPITDGRRDHAKLEDVARFTDIREFLKHFGQASRAHAENQLKSMTCDEGMRNLAVCPICYNVTKHCECQLQSNLVTRGWRGVCHMPLKLMTTFFTAFVCFQWFISLQMYLAKWRVARFLFIRYLLPFYPNHQQLSLLGRINSGVNIDRKWRYVLIFLATLVSALTLYYRMKPDDRKREEREAEEESKNEYAAQGNMYSSTEDQLAKEQRQNVWYNETMELTKFDLPIASQSLSNVSNDELRNIFDRNCVYVKIRGRGNNNYCMEAGAVFLRGHYLLLNNHLLKSDCTHYELEIIQSSPSEGINSNIKLTVKSSSVFRDMDFDACLIEVSCLPPFKDITKFWNTAEVNSVSGLSLQRRENGRMIYREVYNLKYYPSFPVEELNRQIPIYLGHMQHNTAAGDCGSIVVAKTPRGCVVAGIHMVGHQEFCGFSAITLTAIEALIDKCKQHYNKVEVMGGGEPNLSLQNKQIILEQPHHRSLFRYLNVGTCNVYGSIVGMRPKPKSKVCPTPLSARMLDYFGVSNDFCKPEMDGWEVWRNNIVHMIQPTVNYDKDVLAHCVSTFSKEIVELLPEGWEKELVFLSDKAAINGLPGVMYIDKINCNSSMGHPWNCTKKNFLHADPCEKYPDGVNFGPEVWERVRDIEKKYKEGRRAFPIFTGHLKDEPITKAKRDKKKTRVFTGAPIDWSIVVRSRLLAFVRLLQKNKIIFEAGPGTVCQSREWGQIREFITAFGLDRMIAGDYGKFDKRMIADFVLAAFQVICEIYRAAGFSEEEILEIMCIGEDTAFPVVNMNGDLVEFFGTNPSGHPLTVIINSIVNCLYMRYCYTILNPEHTCVGFKDKVHLFTYGDDNIMGVSPLCDWFNHTAIQKVLADIGVEYTMADKESESVPFVHIDSCQFLKRSWRFDEDIGDWLCPLDEASIIKSLTMWVPSKSIDKYAQMVAVISSANSEYFFYGKTVFEKHHKFFRQILDEEPFKFYEKSGTLPTWEELSQRFEAASSPA